MLAPEKCHVVKTYAQVNDVLYDFKGFFILKQQKDVSQLQVSPSKRKNAAAKQKMERQQSLSNNLEDMIDFDYLLVEAFDPRGMTYHVLLSIKKLTAILMSNPYEVQRNWVMVQNKDRDRLIQYLKTFTRIDDVMKIMTIDVI